MPPLRKELPGFYYDEAKNRYFPLSSKPSGSAPAQKEPRISPKTKGSSSSAAGDAPPGAIPRQKYVSTHSLLRRAIARPFHHQRTSGSREYLTRQILGSNSAYGEYLVAAPDVATPSRCYAIDPDRTERQVVGVGCGVFFTRPLHSHYWLTRTLTREPSTYVNSVSIRGPLSLLTALGDHSYVCLRQEPYPPFEVFTHTNGVMNNHGRDIYCSAFVGDGFVLGVRSGFGVMDDCSRFYGTAGLQTDLRIIPTKTDIMTIVGYESLVFAGGRNGGIWQHDLRVPNLASPLLYGPTTVTNITPLRSWELMTTFIDGQVEIYDVRSLRSKASSAVSGRGKHPSSTVNPMLKLQGHVSSCVPNAPVALHPSQSFVFMGGEDGRVRAWNTHTGARLDPPSNEANSPELVGSHARPGLFSRRFSSSLDDRISGMHFSSGNNDEDGGWPALWIAAGWHVWRWDLGKSMG